MKTNKELFDELWNILYSKDKKLSQDIDPQVKKTLDCLYSFATHPEPDYKMMFHEIEKTYVSQKGYRILHLLKYAAIIVLPLLLCLGGIFFLKKEPVEIAMSSEKQRDAIFLTLSDGNEINLSEKHQEGWITDDMVNIRQDSVEGLVYEEGKIRDTVQRYNVLEIPVAADFRLKLSDGTVVYLNSGSKLKYPEVFKGKERNVMLDGEAYFEVARDEKHPFKVTVRNVEVEVLGTSFNINAYPERKEIQTTLAQGKVNVTNGKKQVVLTPGEQAICTDGDIRVREVDVREFISWKNGLFMFNRMTLTEIMMQMERWYGLHIVFFSPDIEKYTFTGVIDKNLPAEETFKVIEKVVDVRFTLKDKNVVITKLK